MEENAFQEKHDDAASNLSGVEKTEPSIPVSNLSHEAAIEAKSGETKEASELLSTNSNRADNTTSDEVSVVDMLVQVVNQLESFKDDFHSLQQGFDSKIKYDSSKDRIVDSLHRELQLYRDGLHFQIMRPIFIDLIAMHDDIANLLKYHKHGEGNGETTTKLLQSLASFQDTIESILERYDVLAFNEAGDQFISQRQRAIRIEATNDPVQDRMVYEHLRKGFEYEGKVLRPEIVSLYKYTAPSILENSSKEVS